MTDAPLALALQDFVPVVFSSAGFAFLASWVGDLDRRAGRAAVLGWLLITAGGLAKATWKLLLVASSGTLDVRWLDNALFVLLAPGFTLAAWAVARRMRSTLSPTPPGSAPMPVLLVGSQLALAAGFAVGTTGQAWFLTLLGVATVASVTLSVLLIIEARRARLPAAIVALAANLVLVLALNGLARADQASVAMQWTEQGLNTIAQGAFAWAVWRLLQTAAAPRGGRITRM